jgi:flagellar biosynthesis protein FlhF
MRMKQISASTMQEALIIARRELGDDAVLLETKKMSKDKGVVVVFAVDEPDEHLFDDDIAGEMDEIVPFRSEIQRPVTAKVELEHPAITLIAEALSYHGVPVVLSQKLMASVYKTHLKPDALIEVAQVVLAEALQEHFVFDPIATGAALPPRRALMLVGPHGAGKTSTIAKLATELTMHRHPVVLISTDTERLNGADSLHKIAEIIKSDFYVAETRAQLKILVTQYLGKAWVLIDSAGANIYEFAQMKALGELASLQDIEPILTCPAGMDADEAQEMATVFDFLAVERMIVTRLDAARRLKGVFAALVAGGYGLGNQTASSNPTDACGPLSAVALSRLMLRHVRERLTH